MPRQVNRGAVTRSGSTPCASCGRRAVTRSGSTPCASRGRSLLVELVCGPHRRPHRHAADDDVFGVLQSLLEPIARYLVDISGKCSLRNLQRDPQSHTRFERVCGSVWSNFVVCWAQRTPELEHHRRSIACPPLFLEAATADCIANAIARGKYCFPPADLVCRETLLAVEHGRSTSVCVCVCHHLARLCRCSCAKVGKVASILHARLSHSCHFGLT